jgi:hypothetical protein
MPQNPAHGPRPDVARIQQTALLRTTLTRMMRYGQQMLTELDQGELNLAHADQLGRSALTVLREAASISARSEHAARSVA